jgi:hypothetical protein
MPRRSPQVPRPEDKTSAIKKLYARPDALAVALAALAVYWNSLVGGFVFDDTSLVVANPVIRSLDPGSLLQMFSSHYWQTVSVHGGLYRPLVVLSYALNYAAGGLNPWGYHFVNVLLHICNTVLVLLIVEALFHDGTFAFWSALFFALHPIRAEAVAYVIGRAESLAALFFMLAWLCYLRRRSVLAGIALLLAVLSKESAFTFLAVPLLADWVERCRPEIKRYLSLAAAAVLALAVRYVVLGGVAPLAITASSNPLARESAAPRILTATCVFARYVWLLIFPVPLSADYSFNQIPVVHSAWNPCFAIGAAVLAALAAALAWSFRRAPALFFCGAFFAATFSLTSNFIRPIGTVMAERLLYLPSLGFTCALAYGIARARQMPRRREAVTAAAVVLALFYGGRTMLRNADWKDHLSLFASAAEVSPNSSLVQANLANALLYQRGDAAQAAEHALAAIRIEPGDPAAYMTLGDACRKLGQLDRAAAAYAEVERLAPGTAGAQEAARRRMQLPQRR